MNTNERVSDEEIIKWIREGDSRGLAALYETYRSEFIPWAIRFTKCTSDEALDYYQAGVLIVYDNIQDGKIEELKSTIKTYLFSVGKNLAWQNRRKEARNQKLSSEYYLQLHVRERNEDDFLVEENNLELISQCFNRLGDPCRSLLDLFYYKKKSMEEIAVELNYKNAETAKNQKYKCMERLRKMVEAEQVKQQVD